MGMESMADWANRLNAPIAGAGSHSEWAHINGLGSFFQQKSGRMAQAHTLSRNQATGQTYNNRKHTRSHYIDRHPYMDLIGHGSPWGPTHLPHAPIYSP